MKLQEMDLIGKRTPSIAEIAKKHGVSIQQIQLQVRKGVKVEQEHTNDRKIAHEIALDHLNEFPDYYDRLKKVEQ